MANIYLVAPCPNCGVNISIQINWMTLDVRTEYKKGCRFPKKFYGLNGKYILGAFENCNCKKALVIAIIKSGFFQRFERQTLPNGFEGNSTYLSRPTTFKPKG